MHAFAGNTTSRLGDGCRNSTPGRGMRQWTNMPQDASMVNTGAEWSRMGPTDRNPLPSQPQVLSDVAHRHARANDSHIFGTSAAAEAAAQARRDELVRARKEAAQARVMQMVGAKDAYRAQSAAEARAALDAQQSARAQQSAVQRAADSAGQGDARRMEAAQEGAYQAQQLARRQASQRVAQEQLAQMQARQQAQAAEKAAERAAARRGDDGTGFQSRFGTSLA